MAVGEVGTLTRGNFGATEDVRVAFELPIENAVVMLTATNNGGDEFSLIVTSVDSSGFTFRVAEWENHDGPHPATETINWIAVEPGIHTLPDGRLIEAGTTFAGTTPTEVALTATFTAPPVILTNRMSQNDPDAADSDPFNITATGFDVALQEATISDGSNAGETVGYIAISPGGDGSSGTAGTSDSLTTSPTTFDLGATFTDAITLAETQSRNDLEAGNVHLRNPTSQTQTRLFFDEEDSDGEGAHATERVGIVTFDSGLIPCYTPGTLITTLRGQVDVARLTPGDFLLTRDSGFQPIRWVAQTTLSCDDVAADETLIPVRIKAGALGPNRPAADMVVSPQHRMLLSGWRAELLTGQSEVLVPAKSLVDGMDIVDMKPKKTTYLHLLLDRHEVIFANGVASESLHTNMIDKGLLSEESRAELLRLFPDLQLGYGETARPVLTMHQGRAFSR